MDIKIDSILKKLSEDKRNIIITALIMLLIISVFVFVPKGSDKTNDYIIAIELLEKDRMQLQSLLIDYINAVTYKDEQGRRYIRLTPEEIVYNMAYESDRLAEITQELKELIND